MMKKTALTFLFAGFLAAMPFAGANAAPGVEIVQDACFTLGQKTASGRGATLVSATATTADGKAACKIVLLVPGKDGERPRRETVIVEQ